MVGHIRRGGAGGGAGRDAAPQPGGDAVSIICYATVKISVSVICYLFVCHDLSDRPEPHGARIHRRGSLSPVYRIGRDAAPQTSALIYEGGFSSASPVS